MAEAKVERPKELTLILTLSDEEAVALFYHTQNASSQHETQSLSDVRCAIWHALNQAGVRE